jgi:hypothetical protein
VKIRIVTQASPSFKAVTDITEPNKIEYAERHGLEFLPVSYPTEAATTDKGYSRPACWRRHIEACDWLFQIDGDAMFTNMKTEAKHFCLPDADIVCSWDVMGFHSGVMFLRNCELVRKWLDEVVALKDVDGKLNDFMASSDQGAMVRLLSRRETYENNIPVADCQAYGIRVAEGSKTINRYYGDWKAGDFIFHTPGMAIAQKIQLLSHKAREVIR